jgi:hypothetical protein
MADNSKKIPTPTEVRQIFNDTYNVFYKKWTNPNTVYDSAVMMQEAHELDRKYDGQKIVSIAELIICIENEVLKRRNS